MSQTVLLLDICQYCKTKPELINFHMGLIPGLFQVLSWFCEIMPILKNSNWIQQQEQEVHGWVFITAAKQATGNTFCIITLVSLSKCLAWRTSANMNHYRNIFISLAHFLTLKDSKSTLWILRKGKCVPIHSAVIVQRKQQCIKNTTLQLSNGENIWVLFSMDYIRLTYFHLMHFRVSAPCTIACSA